MLLLFYFFLYLRFYLLDFGINFQVIQISLYFSNPARKMTTPEKSIIVASSSTALAIIDLDALPKSRRQKRRRAQVLDEDEYLARLETIVQRDYFPDIKKLRAQNDYLDAVQKNDQAKIKSLQQQFSLRRTDKRLATPSTYTSGYYWTDMIFFVRVLCRITGVF